MGTSDKPIEKRIVSDRRKTSTPMVSRYACTGGRRKIVRREEDRKKHVFVDVYGPALWASLLLLMVFSLADAYLTLLLIKKGIAVEANPVLAFCLGFGDAPFVLVKSLTMAISLCIFCLCSNCTTARVLLALAIVLYFSIVVYELSLFYQHSLRIV